jgi:uncharacterized Zn finger protein
MCKHVAAVMYGVGARLDTQPQLLFMLRNVEHGELLATVPALEVTRGSGGKRIAEENLAGVFGIELAETPSKRSTARKRPAGKPAPPPAAQRARGAAKARATKQRRTKRRSDR